MKTAVNILGVSKDIVKPMNEMKPCEVCVIIGESKYSGTYVMRTSSRNSFEIMQIKPNPHVDGYWTYGTNLSVRQLAKGEKVVMEFEGE